MSITGFLLLLLIAAAAGAIGQRIAGYSLGGLIVSIIVGFLGALLGTWIAAQFHLPEILAVTIDGTSFPLFWAVLGSAVVTVIASWVSRPRRIYYNQ